MKEIVLILQELVMGSGQKSILVVVRNAYMGYGNRLILNSFLEALALSPYVSWAFLDVEDVANSSFDPNTSYDVVVSWQNSVFYLPDDMKTLLNTRIAFLFFDSVLPIYYNDIYQNEAQRVLWETNDLFVYDAFYVDVLRDLGFSSVHFFPLFCEFPAMKNVEKQYDLSFVGTMESPFNLFTEEALSKLSVEKQSKFRDCYDLQLQDPSVPFYKNFLQTFVGDTVFSNLLHDKELAYYYEFFSNIATYRLRQYYLQQVAEEFPVHIFTQDTHAHWQHSNMIISSAKTSIDQLQLVYQQSKVNLNFVHLQIIKSVNQRFFNVSYDCGQLLSLQHANSLDLFEGALPDVYFSSVADLKEKVAILLASPQQDMRAMKEVIDSKHLASHRIQQLLDAMES